MRVSWKVCCFKHEEKNYKMEVLYERCPVFLECVGAASSACECFSLISKRNKALTALLWLHLPPLLVSSWLFESLFFSLLLFVPRSYTAVNCWALGSTRKIGSSLGGQISCAFLAPGAVALKRQSLYPLNAPSTESCLIEVCFFFGITTHEWPNLQFLRPPEE